MIDIFAYDFIIRGLQAGLVIGVIAPLIGIFLVLRRYSLIADTLSHVSLAGVAIGLLLGVSPVLTAMIAAVFSSVAIERLRISKRVYGESALSIFLSGSLAVAVVLIGFANGFNTNLFNFLFGSILAVRETDVVRIAILGIVIIGLVVAFFKELVYVSFDEQSARVGGIPVTFINILFIILAALTVALAIPILGVLLISALVVIPVITALQFKKDFLHTIVIAEIISIFSVISGVVMSFYFDLAAGGSIVLIALFLFLLSLIVNKK